MFDIENSFHKNLAPFLFERSLSTLSIADDFSLIYFLIDYGEKFHDRLFIEKGKVLFKANCDKILRLIAIGEVSPFGLRSEHTSLLFLLKLLSNRGVSSASFNAVIRECEDKLLTQIMSNLHSNNLDFIYGALGEINCVLVDPVNPQICSILSSLTVEKFRKNTTLHKSGVYIRNMLFSESSLDLGIAHGLCAGLKILCCIHKKHPSKDCAELIEKIVAFYREISHRSANKVSSFGDYYIDESVELYSRLGWCHGDLSIGYILLQMSLIMDDAKAYEWAIEILLHSCKRKTLTETGVEDPFFCHGSSGVAYIYYKTFKKTGCQEFLDATQYWSNVTEAFFNDDKWYRNQSANLLTGLLGIGFVYSSILTDDFSWDSLVMLNEL